MVPTIKAKISRPCFSLSLAHAVIKTLEKNGKFLLRGLICFACSLKKKLDLQASCHVISNFLSVKIRQIFSPNLCWEKFTKLVWKFRSFQFYFSRQEDCEYAWQLWRKLISSFIVRSRKRLSIVINGFLIAHSNALENADLVNAS